MMKKIYSYLYLVVFIVLILLPFIAYFFPFSQKVTENRENRNMATLPHLDIKQLDVYPGEFDNYYNDNFRFRADLLAFNSYVKINVYNESPHSSVILGQEGWLYTQKYSNAYTAKKLFTKKELSDFRELYMVRSEWLKEKGVKNYIFIIPTKPNVYSEYLPHSMVKYNPYNMRQQFVEATRAIDNLEVIDLEPILNNAKQNTGIRLYHKTDQHWNDYGAFVAYTEIINELRKDFPEINPIQDADYQIDSIETNGKELAKTILMEKEMIEMDIKVKVIEKKSTLYKPENLYPIPEKFPYKSQFQIHYKTNDTLLPKIMLVRDSYTNALKNILPESFSETVFIWDNWCYRLNEDIVIHEKPDIYVTILIESNLSYILHKHPSER